MDTTERPILCRKMTTLEIWALGVGIVVCGQYFGWNLGLKDNGPVAMLVASLIVCLLYLTWVLALAELSVAMPFAGGPLAYGRRTSGPLLGFVMGWSMLLECQFATIATALATGGYIAFLVNPDNPEPSVRVGVGLAGCSARTRTRQLASCAALSGDRACWSSPWRRSSESP